MNTMSDKKHKHWLSLKAIASSEVAWIQEGRLMAKFTGSNEDGLSAKIATITKIDSNFVYIRCYDNQWIWLQDNI